VPGGLEKRGPLFDAESLPKVLVTPAPVFIRQEVRVLPHEYCREHFARHTAHCYRQLFASSLLCMSAALRVPQLCLGVLKHLYSSTCVNVTNCAVHSILMILCRQTISAFWRTCWVSGRE